MDNPKTKLIPFANLTIKGLIQKLAALYNVSEPSILFVTTTDRYNVAKRLAGQGSNPALNYPRLFVHLTNIGRGHSEDGYGNVRSQAKNGHLIHSMTDNQSAYRKIALIPCIYDLEVLYLDDDFMRALQFSTQWMVSSVNNRMNFTVNYYGLPVDVRIEMATEMSTPDRDETVDSVNHYEYITTMRVFSRIESLHPDDNGYVPMLKNVRVEVSMDPMKDTDPFVYDPLRNCNKTDYK